MIGRLRHVVLDCPDPAALAGFYSRLLGQPITYQSDDSRAAPVNSQTGIMTGMTMKIKFDRSIVLASVQSDALRAARGQPGAGLPGRPRWRPRHPPPHGRLRGDLPAALCGLAAGPV
jgi:Glyoxalase-like domain